MGRGPLVADAASVGAQPSRRWQRRPRGARHQFCVVDRRAVLAYAGEYGHAHPATGRIRGEYAMLTLLGSNRRCCDGLTRRETLRAGAFSLLGGLTLPDILRAEHIGDVRRGPGQAKNVIVLYLLGGAATQDMFDLKPNAPAEIRGEFRPVPTSAPGVQICEHLPRMA